MFRTLILAALALGACGHSAPSKPWNPVVDPHPVQACLNLGPDGDAGAWVGSCGNVYVDGSGNTCAVCFYDQGCSTPQGVYCVQDNTCADPVCSTVKARRKSKP